MINVYTKKLKYKRKICLVTNGEGAMSSEGLGDIAEKLKTDNIELVVLYGSRPRQTTFSTYSGLEALISMILISALRRKTKMRRK